MLYQYCIIQIKYCRILTTKTPTFMHYTYTYTHNDIITSKSTTSARTTCTYIVCRHILFVYMYIYLYACIFTCTKNTRRKALGVKTFYLPLRFPLPLHQLSITYITQKWFLIYVLCKCRS